jgi:hypothetical protein
MRDAIMRVFPDPVGATMIVREVGCVLHTEMTAWTALVW